MPLAVILGGTGAIGITLSQRLIAEGFNVIVTGRDPAHVPPALEETAARFIVADRDDPATLTGLLAQGADLVVDCVCYHERQAAMLVPYLDNVARTVMISSKAVYIDSLGNHSNSEEPARFDGPISEDQPTIRPNGADWTTSAGYGANKVAAEETLLDTGYPVSILRPSKVHGAYARRPREWVYVRRILDGRRTLLTSPERSGVDHPSAAANIAALITTLTPLQGSHVLNIADPDAPSGVEIARIVAQQLDTTFDEMSIDTGTDRRFNPWDSRYPVVLDTSRAEALDYRPIGDYATTVAAEIDWLVDLAHHRKTSQFDEDPFFAPFFDYAFEDRLLATASRRP